MRVDCWRACILGHLRANHGRAASYKPTSQNLTEYECEETLEHEVSYTHARRFGARCHARKVTARILRAECWRACVLGHLRANHGRAASFKPMHQPQLTEYDCEETLEHKVSYTHARRFGARCHARKVTARICA